MAAREVGHKIVRGGGGTAVLPLILLLLLASLACNLPLIGGDPLPTVAATAEPPPTEDVRQLTAAAAVPPTNTVPPTPTPTATPTVTPTPLLRTAVPDTPTPTIIVTVPPEEVTPEPTVVEEGRLVPGERRTAVLASGQFEAYDFSGTALRPVFLFVEGERSLDMVLSAHRGSLAEDEPLPGGALAQADFGGPGLVELLVFTPPEDGEYSLVVSGGSSAGQFTVYLFDGVTEAQNVQLVEGELPAEGSSAFDVESNGARPVIAFVDPLGRSNLGLRIDALGSDVSLEADYGGNGSAEALFVLPLGTTAYEVTVFDAGGSASTYNLALVTLGEQPETEE